MRDPGGQLSNRLQFLGLPQLLFQMSSFGDIGARHQQPDTLVVGEGNPIDGGSEKTSATVLFEWQVDTSVGLSSSQPGVDLCLEVGDDPLDSAVFE